jgi:hypothetical protein
MDMTERPNIAAADGRPVTVSMGFLVHTTRSLRIAAVAAALSACAASPSYDAALQPWAGAQEAEVLRHWGPPERSYEQGGRTFLVYEFRHTVHIPATPQTLSRSGPVGGGPAMDVELRCTTTFELEQSKVVAWSYRGNGCSPRRAGPSRRTLSRGACPAAGARAARASPASSACGARSIRPAVTA